MIDNTLLIERKKLELHTYTSIKNCHVLYVLFLSSKHFLFNVSCEIQIAKYCIVILTFQANFIFFQFFHIKKCWEVCQLSTYRNYIVLEKDMESQ